MTSSALTKNVQCMLGWVLTAELTGQTFSTQEICSALAHQQKKEMQHVSIVYTAMFKGEGHVRFRLSVHNDIARPWIRTG